MGITGLFAHGAAPGLHWAWMVAGLLTIPLLVALNAFFVAAEFALIAVRRTRVEEMIKQGRPRARALLHSLDKLNDSVAAAQLGITLASLALGFVSEPALAKLISPMFQALPAGWHGAVTHTCSVAITLGLITYLHVVFGEQMPKLAALQSSERIALWVAIPINLFVRLTRPIVRLMNGSSNLLLRLFGFRSRANVEEVHSVEELLLLIEDTEEAGVIDPEQAEIVENVFRLSDKKVRDCLISREKMDVLELTSTPDQILDVVRKGAHTRMPVCEGDLDRIVGVVNTKDLFYLYSLRGAVVLDDALYPATFLDPEESIATALQLFRKSRKPMAIVRDSEGKVHGLITLEDVVEEIVGDIEDEHDRPVRKLVRRRRKRV
jgi:CBS domain containing-hemolysin-like protein